MEKRPGGRTKIRVRLVGDSGDKWKEDHLATEEPLEIRLKARGSTRTLAVTMRTPGADFELAAGFLRSENVIVGPADVRRIVYCTDAELDAAQQYNVVSVELTARELPDPRRLERHSFTSSACGVCGKAGLESLEVAGCSALPPGPEVAPEVLYGLPSKLREAQGLFDSTGGLHAAGLFTAEGELICVREDVGRHNAVDKVVGWALLDGRLPLAKHILLVSGRASFEIMQKALVAGIPIVCAVSAPSSLAASVAREFGMTLVGFLREGRFNVYAGHERVPVGKERIRA
jgi:FdhD protein